MIMAAITGISAELVSHYEFEGDWTNSVAGALAAEVREGAAFTTDSGGKAANLAAAGWLYVGYDPKLEGITTQMSLSVWVRSTENNWAANNRIMTRGYAWSLQVEGNANAGFIAAGEPAPLRGAMQINDGQWHHIAVTWDCVSGERKLYVDGRLDVQDTYILEAIPNHSRYAIGGRAVTETEAASVYRGYVDDVRVYNSIMSTDEIGGIFIQKHKPLALFEATVYNDFVRLTFSKSEWYQGGSGYDALFQSIRIYRKSVGFIFNKDHKQAFDGLSWQDADLIYQGYIKPEYGKRFTYDDKSAVIGKTYAYWVAAADGSPTGPCPVKIRDSQIWWSYSKLRKECCDLQEGYPELVKVEYIGRTVGGKDILALKAGNGSKKIALIGSIHASEAGAELIVAVIRLLLSENEELFNDISIVAIPRVNIDERQKNVEGVPWYLRKNTAGVDLNRNFPGDWEIVSEMYGSDSSNPRASTYRGPSAASEPETQAVISYIKRNRPSVLFSYHHLTVIAGMRLLGPEAAKGNVEFRQQSEKIFNEYGRGYCAAYPDEEIDLDNRVPFGLKTTPGSLPTWCYREFGIPGFDVEGEAVSDAALSDTVDIELLTQNRRQHAAAILEVIKGM